MNESQRCHRGVDVVTSKKRLPRVPTHRQALAAVAQLGGHIRNNGEPGWFVLGRGFDKLLTMFEVAWVAAKESAERTDQS